MNNSGSPYAGGNFEYDVFLSYAWVNNNEQGPADAWVSEFRARLGAALDARLGRTGRSKFFFDIETLGKNVDFGPQIEDALRKSATVVAVISKGYIESPNCREEMRFFDQILQMPVSKSGRLYLVWHDARKSQSEWPDGNRDEFDRRVQGLIGYEFSAPLPAVPSGTPRRPDDSEYQTSLLQLTTALARYLTDLRKQTPSDAVPAPTTPAAPHTPDEIRASGPTVLIGQAATCSNILRKRRDLANWCRNAGLNVLGEREYSPSPAEFNSDFAAELERAQLLVQLLGDSWHSGDKDDYPDGREAWQQQQAAESGIDVIQWRDVAIKRPTADERADFNDDERRNFELIFGSQVMTAQPAELHRLVVERAQAAFDLGPITPVSEGEPSLLIKVTEADFRSHEATLVEIRNQAVLSFAHNGRSVVERYRRRKFDAVMVVLGKECKLEKWLDEREDELVQSSQTFRETGPVHAWFNAGDYPGAPPLLAPGFLLLNGKQDLPVLFKAMEKKRGAS